MRKGKGFKTQLDGTSVQALFNFFNEVKKKNKKNETVNSAVSHCENRSNRSRGSRTELRLARYVCVCKLYSNN